MLIKNYSKIFYLFLTFHFLVWIFVPTFTNLNLPLDTIEALAWGSNLSWGYAKHPPMSAFMVELIYSFFGNNDWAYYLLSQICVLIALIYVWKFANSFFNSNFYAFCSSIVLVGVYYFNFTTPEFNVNVCLLPFWSLSVYYSWKALNEKKTSDFILMGVFMAFGFLSKYLFIFLIIAIKIIFLFEILKDKKFDIKFFIPGIVFIILIIPHLIWLYQNNFITLSYAFSRTGIDEKEMIDHILNPLIFFLKQLLILTPVAIIFNSLLKKRKINLNFKQKKNKFILLIFFVPLILILLTSLVSGAKIRTMWMTPFYLFLGVFLVQLFIQEIKKEKIYNFVILVTIFFLISPIGYAYVSIKNEFKRTDYPGQEIANLVQRRWNDNFSNNISIVVGDEWYAGNLSYHLQSRPTWYNTIENNLSIVSSNTGVIYTGNPKILKKSCPGVYGTIKPIGICMIGRK